MSWLSSWLHPQRGYNAAQEQYDKYYNQAQGPLNEYMKNLMDPQALQDKWMKGYKESEQAKNMEGMAQQHGLDAASSMGLMGSSPALSAIQAGTSQIGANDRQNYLNDLMDKYKTGAGVAGQASQNAMNMGDRSGSMAYGQQNAGGDLFGGIAGGIGKTLLDFLTGNHGGGGNSWNTGGR